MSRVSCQEAKRWPWAGRVKLPDKEDPPALHKAVAMPKRESEKEPVVPVERIGQQTYLIRGRKVMLDASLAKLYQVSTKRLN